MPAMATWPAFAFSALLVAACSEDPPAQRDGVAGLTAFIAATHAGCTRPDKKAGAVLVRSVVPDAAALQRVLRDDVAAQQRERLAALFRELPEADDQTACVFLPGQGRTEIHVTTATVEELAAEGTPTLGAFPSGARGLARTALRPTLRFYEVEVTVPGQDGGTKFHMFFWDGRAWKMLGPAWRAMRD